MQALGVSSIASRQRSILECELRDARDVANGFDGVLYLSNDGCLISVELPIP